MTGTEINFDVAIVGGGLAGLSLSIQIRNAGFSVVLLEKEVYPFHKVCGEYISKESWSFLENLGIPLSDMHLPLINNLVVTAPNGKKITAPLTLGGFGISRYTLDHQLSVLAKEKGVKVLEGAKVVQTEKITDKFNVHFSVGNEKKMITSRLCCASFGKRSNLDVKWKRSFLNSRQKGLQNYVGVKYHVYYNGDEQTIALHNFKNGYCGISKIEDNKYCLCYLTTSADLKNCNNSIYNLEQNVLQQNPYLRELFKNIRKIEGFPVTISQINFNKKNLVENDILMIGDAAGMIAPLCGNGMSMALHAAKIAATLIKDHFAGKIDFLEFKNQYQKKWRKEFENRMKTGRMIQRFFGGIFTTNIFISFLRLFPGITSLIIKKTHGSPF
jgi:flavin-dependent dehydrogenase